MIAQVIKVNEILEQALLFDFYGELLTEHQKEIYGQFIQEDLSLGEIAKEAGISRQGVHDLIRRCTQTLKGYEEKLHLVQKFLNAKVQVENIYKYANQILSEKDNPDGMLECVRRIEQISSRILEEM